MLFDSNATFFSFYAYEMLYHGMGYYNAEMIESCGYTGNTDYDQSFNNSMNYYYTSSLTNSTSNEMKYLKNTLLELNEELSPYQLC